MVRSSRLRVARAVAASVTFAGAAIAPLAGVACITAPPPDLPQLPDQAPMILHDAVFPPQGNLTEWPDGGSFTVPVKMAKPGEAFFYAVVYDYGTPIQFPAVAPTQVSALPDGGTELIPLTLKQPTDKRVCPHEIAFIAAARFQPGGTTPNPVDGDIVTWTFFPNGTPTGCPPYDAGTGAFPDGGDQ
jgi:hypothetical protein